MAWSFLYRVIAVRPEMVSEGLTESESRIVSDHSSYLQNLADKGIVILFGHTQNTDNNSSGIVIFNAESEKDARKIMRNDTAVKEPSNACRIVSLPNCPFESRELYSHEAMKAGITLEN